MCWLVERAREREEQKNVTWKTMAKRPPQMQVIHRNWPDFAYDSLFTWLIWYFIIKCERRRQHNWALMCTALWGFFNSSPELMTNIALCECARRARSVGQHICSFAWFLFSSISALFWCCLVPLFFLSSFLFQFFAFLRKPKFQFVLQIRRWLENIHRARKRDTSKRTRNRSRTCQTNNYVRTYIHTNSFNSLTLLRIWIKWLGQWEWLAYTV